MTVAFDLVQAGGLDQSNDLAAVLADRLDKLTSTRSDGTRPRRRPRYVAGLIREANGPMPAYMRPTPTVLADLIERRADALADQAVQERQPWVRRLGPVPADPAQRLAWQQQVRTLAAYCDRYHITSSDPLGPAPASQGQRLDHRRASIAARRAQTTTSRSVTRRPGRDQQIDTSRDLSR